MLEWIRFAAVAALMLGGLFILVCAVVGIYKFDYVLNRMHAAAMGDTLGLLLALAALMVACSDWFMILKLALAVVFLWAASPVASHLICRLETKIRDMWNHPTDL